MKLTYDPLHNIAYLKFHEAGEQVTTLCISNELNIDIAPDGTLYGIEMLNANAQLAEDGGNLILELGNTRQELALAA
jgi:uncharacterized protein YuzE